MKKIPHRNKNKHARSTGGFSLVEVLFALFLVALVIGVSSKVVSNSVRNTTSIKESTFARWVALNQLDAYKIEIAQNGGSSTGNDSGESEMGNMNWRWVREVVNSNSADLLEIRVIVYRAGDVGDDDPVMMVKGYTPAL